MSIFKKRLVPLIAVICAFICFTVLGLTLMLKPEQTFADTATTPTVTNVEDYYKNDVQIYSGVCAGSGNILKLGTSTVDIEKSTTNGTFKTYVSTKTSTEDTQHNSKNTYAGNLSILTSPGSNTSSKPETTFGIYANKADNVIAFRTVYLGKNINLIGRLGGTSYAGSGGGVGGYNFAVSNSSVTLIALKDGVNEDGVKDAGQILTSNTTMSSVNYNDSKTLESGDELLITYGAVGTNYYLKIERCKNNALETIIDKFSTPITSDVKFGNDYAEDYMWITSAFNTPLVIGGVEKPIMADLSSAEDVTIDEEKEVGTPVSEIKLPQGYTYVDGTKPVAKGWNAFDVVAGNYYEKQLIKSAYILGAGETVKNVETSITMGYARNKSAGTHTIYNLGFNKQFTPSGQQYSIYVSNMRAEEDSVYSESTFAGNITINAIDDTNTSNKMHAFVDRDNNADAILAFRTKWLGANISLIGRMTDTMWYSDGYGGYQFDVTATAVTLKMCRFTAESLAEKVVDTYPLNSALSTNDELIITYGATTNGEVNSLYIKIEKVVDGNATELLNKFDTPIMYKGTIPHSTSYGGCNFMYVACPGTTPLVIGGVDKPLFDVPVNYTSSESAVVGEKVSTVALESGYAFTNQDAIIRVGEMTYAGTYTTNYYNVANYKFDANIRVVPTATVDVSAINAEDMELIPYFDMGYGAIFGQLNKEKVNVTKNGMTVSTTANDFSKYAGNVTVSKTGETKAATDGGKTYEGNVISPKYIGMQFKRVDNETSTNDVVSFRTVFAENSEIYLIGQMRDTTYAYPGITTLGGYSFIINANGYTLIKSTDNTVIASGTFSTPLEDKDNVIITFGAKVFSETQGVKDETDGKRINDYYIKVEKVASDNSVSILADKIISSDVEIIYPKDAIGNKQRMFALVPVTDTLVIGGINKPIFAEETVDLSSTASGAAFNKLSTVTLDPALGLEFADGTTEIAVNNDTYEGLKAYFNKKYSVDIKIKVNVPNSKAIKLQVGDNEPTLVYTYETKAYVFEEIIIDGKAFIGWIDSEGNIYDAGDALAFEDAVADTVYTLVNITFNLEEGASIRYTSDEKGEYGMRFTLNVDTDVLDNAYISNAKYAIAPTDTYFKDGMFVDGAESVADDLVWTQAALIDDNKIAFAISSIQYQNFAREFGGVAFFTVTYADGGTRVIMTSFDRAKNSRSVYEVSMSLLSDMYRDGLTAKNSDRVGVLEDYVNQVADVTLTEEGETLKVDLSTNYDRTPETIPYEIYATVTESGEGYEVALEITFKAGNGLGEEGTFATRSNVGTKEEPVYGWIVPVIVRVGTEVYEMNPTDGAVVEYKSASAYENYKIVMTFVYTPVKVN